MKTKPEEIDRVASALAKAIQGAARDSMAMTTAPYERGGEIKIKVDGEINLRALARAAIAAVEG